MNPPQPSPPQYEGQPVRRMKGHLEFSCWVKQDQGELHEHFVRGLQRKQPKEHTDRNTGSSPDFVIHINVYFMLAVVMKMTHKLPVWGASWENFSALLRVSHTVYGLLRILTFCNGWDLEQIKKKKSTGQKCTKQSFNKATCLSQADLALCWFISALLFSRHAEEPSEEQGFSNVTWCSAY